MIMRSNTVYIRSINMKKFLYIIFSVLIVVTTVIGTIAFFSSSASGGPNLISSGNIKLNLGKPSVVDVPVDTNGMLPGDSKNIDITVTNGGTLVFSYNVSAVLKSGDENLYRKIDLKIMKYDESKKDYIQVMDMPLNKLKNKLVSSLLKPNESEKLKFILTLPQDLGSRYLGKNINCNFKFNAMQSSN